jgi:hypothetical protein
MAPTRQRAVTIFATLVAIIGLTAALTACDPTQYTLTLAGSPAGPVAIGSQVTFSGKLSGLPREPVTGWVWGQAA